MPRRRGGNGCRHQAGRQRVTPLFTHVPAPAHRGPDEAAHGAGKHRTQTRNRGRGHWANGRPKRPADPCHRYRGSRGRPLPRHAGECADGTSAPATGDAEPTAGGARSRPRGQPAGPDCLPVRGDRVRSRRPARHPPCLRRRSSPPRDATGRDGGHRDCRPTGRCGHVVPLPILATGGMTPLSPPPRSRARRGAARARGRPAARRRKRCPGRSEHHHRPFRRTAAAIRLQPLRAPPGEGWLT